MKSQTKAVALPQVILRTSDSEQESEIQTRHSNLILAGLATGARVGGRVVVALLALSAAVARCGGADRSGSDDIRCTTLDASCKR